MIFHELMLTAQVDVWDNTLFFNATEPANPVASLNNTGTLEIPSGGFSKGACITGRCPVPVRAYVASPRLGAWSVFGEV